MKTILILAAAALGAAITHQAVACELHTANASSTVVVCSNDTCSAVPLTTAQEPADCSGANCAKPEPAAPKLAEEPANPAPTTVVDCSGSRC